MSRRLSVALGIGALVIAWSASAAGAHVTIQPREATQRGFATEFVQVPNERDDASTTSVQVAFPTDHPISFVSVEPVPGWTVNVEKTKLATPITTEDGEITEVVSTVTWSGGTIAPGQFQRFPISMGPLPEDVDSLEFKAVQTYDDGEVVRWIDPAPADGSEAEHPAPVLALTAASDGDTSATTAPAADSASQDDVDSAKTLGIVGIVLGGVALVVAVVALVRRRSA